MNVVNEAVWNLLHEAQPSMTINGLMRKAERDGIDIGRTAVAKAQRGDVQATTRDSTMQAIADLYGVDVRHLREAAGRPRGELGPYVPDHRAASLTSRQREALDRLIVTIVEGDQGAGNTAEKIAGRGEPGDDLRERRDRRVRPARKAARSAPSEKDRPVDKSGDNQDPGGMEPS